MMAEYLKRGVRGALAVLALVSVAGQARAEDNSCKLTAREVVDRFIPLFYEQHDVKKAFETWVAPDYIQHNPMAKDGRDEAIAALGSIFASLPEHKVWIKQVMSEGDRVMVHYMYKSVPSDLGMVVVDIFKVKDCKIVEHWDVIQPMPQTSANPHPMF